MGTTSVETVKAPPVPGMQKPPCRVGKRFWDRLVAAPEKRVKKPAGLKTRRTTRLGVRSRAGLEAADGDDLVQGPDSDGKGAGSTAQNSVGAVVEQLERWDDAVMTDPDEGGGEELSWQLAGQLVTRIVPRQRKSRNILSYRKIINRINRNFFVLQEFVRQHNWSAKNCLSQGKTSVFPRLSTESKEYKG
jgi:hypothetical protein